jgi:hypothetical protein
MAAKFYAGASMHATRTTAQQDKTAAVQRNSMKGLPGFIRTSADTSSGGLAKSKPVAPRFNAGESHTTTTATRQFRKGQGASIGRRGGSGSPKMDSKKFRGSSDTSYRATSTGPAGKIASNRGEPERRGASEKEGPARGKPASGVHQSTVKTKSFNPQGAGHGHPGRMESLRGKARTSWER